VSQRWSAFTLNVNGALLITHDHNLGAFAGTIVEGPYKWVIRPVAEVTLEQDAGRTTSALIGAIWQVRHNLSLDAGWRVAWSEGADVREFVPALHGRFRSAQAVRRVVLRRRARRPDGGEVRSRAVCRQRGAVREMVGIPGPTGSYVLPAVQSARDTRQDKSSRFHSAPSIVSAVH
jgi:hypothetical protein